MDGARPFQPIGGAGFIIANAVASAAEVVVTDGSEMSFYNSSATALAFVRVTREVTSADTAAAATVTTDQVIPPLALLRFSFGRGRKGVRAIASAADGSLYVMPGNGF